MVDLWCNVKSLVTSVTTYHLYVWQHSGTNRMLVAPSTTTAEVVTWLPANITARPDILPTYNWKHGQLRDTQYQNGYWWFGRKCTPNASINFSPICLPKPKNLGFLKKKLSLGVRSPCPSTYLISVSWHLTAIVLSVQGRNRHYSRANWLHPLCQEIKIIADVDDLNIPLFGDIAF